MYIKNKGKKRVSIIFLILIFLAINLTFVNAFGIASPYWNDNPPNNPLVMDKGETRTIEFNIQNGDSDEDTQVTAEIANGTEIARLKEKIILVKAKTNDNKFPLEISIPKNATGTYEVKLLFKSVTSGESGAVKMGIGMRISFDVIVSENIAEEKPSIIQSYLLYIIIGAAGILILAIMTIIFIKKRGKTKNKQKNKHQRKSSR